VAETVSLVEDIDQLYSFMFEGHEEETFKSTVKGATVAKLDSAEGTESVLTMEGEEFGFFGDGLTGEIPETLDDLVDCLGINETSGTAESFDAQHYSAFASEDMWPI